MNPDSASAIRSYTIILEPTADGWRGYCLAIPECTGYGDSRRQAHRAVKASIRRYLWRCLCEGRTPPVDRTITKSFRIDLRDLQPDDEDELR